MADYQIFRERLVGGPRSRRAAACERSSPEVVATPSLSWSWRGWRRFLLDDIHYEGLAQGMGLYSVITIVK
jgi:hypothetical protein